MPESQAAVFHGTAGTLELTHFPIPRAGPGEVVVRVLGCTLCGSDLHTFDGRRTTPTPTILGHEIIGRIEQIGDGPEPHDLDGSPLRIGDRVTWAIVANCGECFYCRRNLPQKCLAAVKFGHESLRPGRELLGGLAEHCLLPRGTGIVRLPDDLPAEVACPASCATATVAAAFDAGGVDLQGTSVCIVGAGMLGLTAAAWARDRGAAAVVCVDPAEQRRATALQFGAHQAVPPDEQATAARATTGGHGFDTILDFSGSPAAIAQSLPLTRLGGTIVLVGSVFPTAAVQVFPEQIVRRQLTLRGVHNYAPRHLAQAVNFLHAAHQRYPFASLVSDWLPLDEVLRAFDWARNGAIRVGVKP